MVNLADESWPFGVFDEEQKQLLPAPNPSSSFCIK